MISIVTLWTERGEGGSEEGSLAHRGYKRVPLLSARYRQLYGHLVAPGAFASRRVASRACPGARGGWRCPHMKDGVRHE